MAIADRAQRQIEPGVGAHPSPHLRGILAVKSDPLRIAAQGTQSECFIAPMLWRWTADNAYGNQNNGSGHRPHQLPVVLRAGFLT